MATHVDTLRAVYERLAEGDMMAAEPLLDEHVVYMNTPDFVERVLWGREAAVEFVRGFAADWEGFVVEASWLREAGDSVVAGVRQSGVGHESGAPVELTYFQVWTFRGDRVIRVENFWEEREALEVVGLAP